MFPESDYEKQLRATVRNQELLASLASIRFAVDSLTSAGPPLVRNYTDHGIQHSVRMLEHLQSLLDGAGPSMPSLSEDELYVAAAAAYLHDVGMFCDLQAWPAVRAVSAANYGVELTGIWESTQSAELGEQEQEELRRNHPVVGASWIEASREDVASPLHAAATSIPNRLMSDLLEVCVHHAGREISACSEISPGNPALRLQLCAALVRFCDELDISYERADYERARAFRVPPGNLLWWYLHSCTLVTHTGPIVTVTVRLHPDDARLYSGLVERTVIDRLQSKCEMVLQVLRREGLQASIDRGSKVYPYRFFDRVPADLREELVRIAAETASRDCGEGPTDDIAGPLVAGKIKQRRGLSAILEEADAARHESKYHEAKTLLAAALEIEDNIDVRARLLRVMQDADAPDADVRPVLEPLDPVTQSEVTALAAALSGEPDLVLKSLEGLGEVPGAQGANIRYLRALALSRKFGRTDEALSELDQAQQLSPVDFRFPILRAELLLEKGQPEAALKEADRAVELERPPQGYSTAARGDVFRWTGQWSAAADEYRVAVDLGNTSLPVTCRLAQALYEAKLYKAAIEAGERAAERCGRCGLASRTLAASHYQIGDYPTALKCVEKVLAERPGDKRALFLRGRCLTRLGNPEEAISQFDAALAAGVEPRCVLCERGQALFDLGDYEGALKDLDQALESEATEECETAHNSRGLALLNLGRPAQALHDYRAAALAVPSERNLLSLACMYIILNDPEAAALSVNRALGLQQRTEDVGNCLWFKWAAVALRCPLRDVRQRMIADIEASAGSTSDRDFTYAYGPLEDNAVDKDFVDVLKIWAAVLGGKAPQERLDERVAADNAERPEATET